MSDTYEIKAACRGCHGGCMHILTVEEGRVVKTRPDPDGPLNHGRACCKGYTIIEQMYHPDRILYPLRRVGPKGSGKWERVTWDEAYGIITGRLHELWSKHGKECVAATTGTGRHHMAQFWRFANVLGTPNATSSGALICLGPRKNAGDFTAGVFAGVDYYGDIKPAGILVWGANPAISGADGELQWHIKDAVRAGTALIVVDPQPNELTEKAVVWLRLRPGTDGALAMGVLNAIIMEGLYDHEFVENWTYGFDQLRERVKEYTPEKTAEICWLNPADIIRAARLIASIKPLSLEWGCALEQTTNAFQTCRAIFMITGITGNWDVPGGFVASKEIAPTVYPMFEALPEEMNKKCISGGYPLNDGTASPKMFAHPYETFDAMKTGVPYKIRALFSNANNCLISMPDSMHAYECLKKLEFFVYMDFFMTPTAQLADLILPAALWAEVDSFFCMPEFGDQALLTMRRVVDVGECKSDEDFFMELCQRLELDYGADGQKALLNELLGEMGRRYPEYAETDFDKLKEIGYIVPGREYYGYKKSGFGTPSGKFELYSLRLKNLGGDPLPFWTEVPESPVSRPDLSENYPLVLTTGSRKQQYFISNGRQIKTLRKAAPFPLVSMHPDTATRYGIREGDWVWIETPRGKITQKAKFKPGLDPRVINCEMGWWYPEAGAPGYGWDDSNVNILTSGQRPCDPFGGAYQLRALLCRISKNNNCNIEERYFRSKLYFDLPADESSLSIVIDPNRCILCGDCITACNMQGISALEIATLDGITRVMAKGGKLSNSGCVGCGQCRVACPEGAIVIKSDIEAVKAALDDPGIYVVAQIAPSVRVSAGSAFGIADGDNAAAHLIGAMRTLGFDSVFDTVFSADLTVIEESEEFVEKLNKGETLFTSCCPAWVTFCEKNYPELSENISTCRSPMQMLGSILREYFADGARCGGKRVVSVSVMPCTAKKGEIHRFMRDGQRDIDFSITITELMELMRARGIGPENVVPSEADEPYGAGSGGGAIFGISGGVTEAVLRQLVPGRTEFGVRGFGSSLETELDYGGKRAKIAVVSGLQNARGIMERIKGGEHFDLVEVMACNGGCIMGGGQPTDPDRALTLQHLRGEGLSRTDGASTVRRSGNNPLTEAAYEDVLKDRAHELLHR